MFCSLSVECFQLRVSICVILCKRNEQKRKKSLKCLKSLQLLTDHYFSTDSLPMCLRSSYCKKWDMYFTDYKLFKTCDMRSLFRTCLCRLHALSRTMSLKLKAVYKCFWNNQIINKTVYVKTTSLQQTGAVDVGC